MKKNPFNEPTSAPVDAPAADNVNEAFDAVNAAIANVDPNVVLRNLAFWLDVAIARGRWVDANMQEDALPTPENNQKSEV